MNTSATPIGGLSPKRSKGIDQSRQDSGRVQNSHKALTNQKTALDIGRRRQSTDKTDTSLDSTNAHVNNTVWMTSRYHRKPNPFRFSTDSQEVAPLVVFPLFLFLTRDLCPCSRDVTGTKWVALLPWRKRSDTRSFTPSIFVAWCCWTVRRSQNDRLQCSRHYSQIFYGEKNSFPSNFARTTGRFS